MASTHPQKPPVENCRRSPNMPPDHDPALILVSSGRSPLRRRARAIAADVRGNCTPERAALIRAAPRVPGATAAVLDNQISPVAQSALFPLMGQT